MRLLVTGNEGYIGTVLVPMLQAAGHEVIGLDTGLFRECALIPFTGTRTLRKDVRDVEPQDVQGFDAVIHLAGLANDPLGDLDPPLTYDINHAATVRLAEIAKRAGVSRFLYASTCSIYGAAGDDLIDEESAPNPITPYADSKRLSEQDLLRMADGSFCPVLLRAATAYGVSPYLRFDLALNNLVAWAYTTHLVYLKSDGMSWRPLVHIRDIAQGYLVLLEAPEALVHGQAFNVGASSENYRIRQLAELVREGVPDSRLEYADGASPDHRSYRVSCDKLSRTLPAYRPQWNAKKGIQEVYETLKDKGLNAEAFEGPRYNRIAHVRHLLKQGRLATDLRWAEPRQAPAAPVLGAQA
jgi:nucleoside-diphosphate-sugar epimerase